MTKIEPKVTNKGTVMLNELKRIAIFNKVVECGSFTLAGEALGMGKSKVSEQVTLLEKNSMCGYFIEQPEKLV